MGLFAVATLAPVGLIAMAALYGGPWGWAALGYITVLVFMIDRLTAREAKNADPEAEFPAADQLLVTLGLAHFALLAMALWAVAGPSGLATLDRILVLLASALLFGQISHPVAHELIHRPPRALRLMGRLIYTSLLMGHHASAHMLIHHAHVGSDKDPNSPPRGMGFWRFAPRAWWQSFIGAYRVETRLRRGKLTLSHPYVIYTVGAVGLISIAGLSLGAGGIAALCVMAIHAQIQILMADYVQHYGLRRARMPDGRLEPVGPQHSWNAPEWYSSAMMVNAPRHSDHHVSPNRPFPALQLDQARMPTLPRSLPVMACIATIPPLWRRIMDPLCEAWRPGWQVVENTPTARDIPPAVLARARTGGVLPGSVPDWRHDTPRPDPLPDDGKRPGHGRRPADDRGGV
ncbi:alkane 1-monooxygenase [Roseovarius sp. A21]|uniref:Alkane 1-monooxygenase n=1 Tax=Roseovarius bejariae TaxID=2576383 RepID=A0A844CZK8_9RHOB|nr:alkane 1-monooxygenase [Roseovarius bejariae]MRU14298.1 alkane 1-monooxygenase [Roseovarius bejariae]